MDRIDKLVTTASCRERLRLHGILIDSSGRQQKLYLEELQALIIAAQEGQKVSFDRSLCDTFVLAQ